MGHKKQSIRRPRKPRTTPSSPRRKKFIKRGKLTLGIPIKKAPRSSVYKIPKDKLSI